MRALAALVLLLSQADWPPSRSFEVASIRVHPAKAHGVAIESSGPRLTVTAENLTGLIMYAYGVEYYEVSEADSDKNLYDIAARAEGNGEPSAAEFRVRMQALLAERFRLRFHREKKQIPIYALVVGKGGPKLKKSSGREECESTSGAWLQGGNYHIELKGCGIDDLADEVDGLDLDKTGIEGNFDVRLVFEQLGLRLVAEKADIDAVVVDRVEKPSEN